MLLITSELKKFGINVPTSTKEYTPEVLNQLTEGIKLPKHHVIVAITSKIKLFDLAMSLRDNTDRGVSVLPLLAKVNPDEAKEFGLTVGDIVTIDRSSLERGIALQIPTAISNSNVQAFIKDDEKLLDSLVRGTHEAFDNTARVARITDSKKQAINKLNDRSPYIVAVSFKIIYLNDIAATMAPDIKLVDPFKVDKLVN